MFSLLRNQKHTFPHQAMGNITKCNMSPTGSLNYRIKESIRKYRGKVNENLHTYKRMTWNKRVKTGADEHQRRMKKRRIIYNEKVFYFYVLYFILITNIFYRKTSIMMEAWLISSEMCLQMRPLHAHLHLLSNISSMIFNYLKTYSISISCNYNYLYTYMFIQA